MTESFLGLGRAAGFQQELTCTCGKCRLTPGLIFRLVRFQILRSPSSAMSCIMLVYWLVQWCFRNGKLLKNKVLVYVNIRKTKVLQTKCHSLCSLGLHLNELKKPVLPLSVSLEMKGLPSRMSPASSGQVLLTTLRTSLNIWAFPGVFCGGITCPEHECIACAFWWVQHC